MSDLTHLDSEGRARMVDVSAKADTTRTAVAAGQLVTTPAVIELVRADDLPKADVLATARIAGISGAKKTSELIPLCHQLALSSVKLEFGFTDTAITIEATAKTKGPTGVEMEALTAVAVAGLTLHDMVKAVDPAATLDGVRLLTKDGGKRGHWTRDQQSTGTPTVTARSAAVLVASTGGARGTREDTTGPVIAAWLEERGFTTRGPLVYADADIAAGLADALSGNPALIISTGGTGVSPTDATPEATRAVLDREAPGFAEALRAEAVRHTPMGILTRGISGISGRTLIVNFPGSPKAIDELFPVLAPTLEHVVRTLRGDSSHHGHRR